MSETILTASDGAAGDEFGLAAAISADGSTVVVGAPNAGGGGTFRGEVYVYTGAGFATETILRASDGVDNDDFGTAVAVSADGSVIVVGISVGGKVYVYSGPGWATETIHTPAATPSGWGSSAVAISGDGSVIAVGQFGYNTPFLSEGRVSVLHGASYATETVLLPSDAAAHPRFGYALSLSNDGSILAAGVATNHQRAYVRSGVLWASETIIAPSVGSLGFGKAVSLSSDGATVAVGAPDGDGINSDSGLAFVYSGPGYATETILQASDGATGDGYGTAVGIAADGSVVAVGAPLFAAGAALGKLYVYSDPGYVTEAGILAGDGVVGDSFGCAVGVGAPESVVVGASEANAAKGKAYVEVLAAPPPAAHVQVLAPPWRWVVAFLDPADMTLSSQTLTFLDRLATNQAVTYALNQPAEATMDAPSDNPEVNILRVGGGRPFLSEGNRFLFGFRREGAGSLPRPAGYPADAPWVIRYAGIILQLERETGTDEPVSHITAYDPWMYWTASRPLVLDDGTLPTSSGVSYAGMRGDEIAVAILTNALAAHGPLFADWGQTAFYAGTIEHTDVLDGINVRQGITVGEALTQLVQTGSLDVVLTPIYDLADRPGLVVEVNIYKQAGSRRNGAIFAWDRPSRSLSALDLLHDGIQRANRVLYWASKGLTIGTVKSPTVDTAPTFGQYWLQKSIQDGTPAPVGDVLAQTQAQLLRAGKQTLTFDPAPERSPLPWQEYFLGDQVPVYATREHFGEEFDAGVVDGDGHWTNLQRVYVLPLKIGDDEVETVEQILTANPDSID